LSTKTRKERNNILLIIEYKYKTMSDKKICIDCGKQFTPKSHEGNAVVCEDCIALLQRRFWSSIKMGKIDDNLRKEDKHNEHSENSHSKKDL
jgi:DNA-directed RNA polymerase subunit RPC12/RpoP